MTTNNLSYYNQLTSLNWSKSFFDAENDKGFLAQEATQEYFEEYTEALLEDPDWFVNNFQNLFTIEQTTYTIGELVAASPLTMQNSLSAKSIEAIWKDANIGFSETGQLLSNIQVGVKPDGSIIVLGGNHRLAAIILPFLITQDMSNPGVVDAVQNISIRVDQYTVNREQVIEALTIDDDGTIIEPTNDTVDREINRHIVKLWNASNASRNMQKSEVSGAKLYERGIDRTSNNELIDAHFYREPGQAKLLSDTECFVWVARNTFNSNSELDYVVDHNGNRVYDSSLMERSLFIPALSNEAQRELTATTFDNIMKGFYSALKADSVEVEKANGKVAKKKIWADDLKDSDSFVRIIESVLSSDNPIIAQAIDNNIANYSPEKDGEDPEYKLNLSRRASKLGAYMYEYAKANGLEPQYDVTAKKEPAPKATRRSARRSTGLGL